MPDQWGNEWDDDAVPGGIEIANVMLEIRKGFGWAEMWGDCNGLRICPRVRVWLDGYQDLDYHESFLLRVWTDFERGSEHVTTTDHLAVYQRHGWTPDNGPSVEWRNDARLFFDADHEWLFDGIRWWVNWTEEESGRPPEGDDYRPLSDELRASIAEHNREITQRERDKARKLGLTLPYLRNLP